MSLENESSPPAESPVPRTLPYQRLILLFQIGVVLVVSGLMIGQGRFPGLDLVTLLLFSLLLWRARDRIFLLNFAPFLLLLITYQSMRNMADTLGFSDVHITDLIAWERALTGGRIPAYELQQTLGAQSYAWLVDIFANAFYMSHFIVPVVLALLLWHYRRAQYWPYLLGLTMLSYAAFLTYVFFPAAPPWWASHYGYLPGMPIALSHSAISPEAIISSGNPVAAMPSLHAAYPLYSSLFCLLVWGRKGIPTLILPLGVAFFSMYLGHHYLIDIFAGWAYAGIAFAGSIILSQKLRIPTRLVNAYQNVMAKFSGERIEKA
ncbi:MAG: phosphatase PAP2 family protein [Anaerolineales bacterium]|nr:phosphatase PAP2 family protein [Anaerolineales bacterium]